MLLKREDLQPVFSFKLRGAYNKMAHLDHNERWKGVIACSAGERDRLQTLSCSMAEMGQETMHKESLTQLVI